MIRWIKRGIIASILGVFLLLVIPYLVPVSGYDDLPLPLPFKESAYTKVEGVAMHYRYWVPDAGREVKGNIVLVHGFCGSTFSWRKQVGELLENGYRICAVDIPAFGYSDRAPTVNHSEGARSGYVWGVLDEVQRQHGLGGETRWNLVGHSMGCGIISAMAQLKPGRTASLIFVDGVASRGGGRPGASLQTRLWSGVMGFGPLRRWVEVYVKYIAFREGYIRKLLTSAFNEEPDDEAIDGYLSALRVPRTASAIIDQWRNREDPNTYDVRSIDAPVLIIWGENDSWIPLERGRKLHEAISGSTLRVIEGGGHCPMETHPEVFLDVILSFLESDQGRGRDLSN